MRFGKRAWAQLLDVPALDEVDLLERFADLLIDQIRRPLISRAVGDSLRLRIVDIDGAGNGSESRILSERANDHLQEALDRVSDAAGSDVEPAAQTLRTLCSGDLVTGCMSATQVLSEVTVLETVLLSTGRGGLDAADVQRLCARGMHLEQALILAGVLAERSWWPNVLREYAIEKTFQGRDIQQIVTCIDDLGWAQLTHLQQKIAIKILDDPASADLDGASVALNIRRVAGPVLAGSSRSSGRRRLGPVAEALKTVR